MRTGRNEALDVFRKWHSESAILQCDISTSHFALSFRLSVFEIFPDRLLFRSADDATELELPLADDLEFWYGEPRDFPEEARTFERGLTVFFPRPAIGDPDFIAFSELSR